LDAANEGRRIDFGNARLEIDETSARDLGLADAPNLELGPFLRQISCETTAQSGNVQFWITKFFESLDGAVDGCGFRSIADSHSDALRTAFR
jgi:hypothetical protein